MKKAIPIITISTLLSACTASIEDGIAAYNAGNSDKAREILNTHPDNPIAQFYLYNIYYHTKKPENNQTAIDYLKKSAQNGHAEAKETLAGKYLRGEDNIPKDAQKAITLYNEAAEKGRKSALVSIGDYYRASADSNLSKTALKYYLLAEGSILGDLRLAEIYEKGELTNQNPKKSFDHLLSANTAQEKEQAFNYPQTQLALAEYYYYGYGTQKDNAKAVNTLKAIKNKGDNDKAFYAWLLFWGEGINPNPSKAVDIWLPLMKKALNARMSGPKINPILNGYTTLNSYAFYGLAIAFTDGRGAKPDPSQTNIFKKTGKIIGTPIELHHWLGYKFNALGYLDKKCSSLEVIGEVTTGSASGRYKSIKADALTAISQCLPKSTSQERIEAYLLAKKASELGNTLASLIALKQFTAMSDKDKELVSTNERLITLRKNLFISSGLAMDRD